MLAICVTMATKGKFRIPSIREMEKQDKSEPKVMSTFAASRSKCSSDTSDSNTRPSVSRSITKSDTTSIPVQRTSSEHPEACTKQSQGTTPTSLCRSTQPAPSSPSKPPCSPLKSGIRNLTSPQSSPVKAAPTNTIVVSARQRGNPILKHIRNIPWEFGDIVPDYQLGQTSCALFLSLRYHQLNPNYIHERLKQLGQTFDLRVLLVHVDIKDPHPCLKDLAKMCILADCTLILAFNPEEAGRYLETYKSFENKPPDLIMERTEGNLMARMTDTLTKVRSVNKTDAMTLMSAFGSFQDIVNATLEDVSLCPGFGPQKAKRLHGVLHEPFLKAKRKCISDEQKQGAQKNKAQADSAQTLRPQKKTSQNNVPE